jgi:hypothetical protein
MTGDRKFPHLAAAKKQCGTKRSKDQKICRSRAASTPVLRLCAGFLTHRSDRPDRTVALEPVPKKFPGFFGSDMLQLFDFERVVIAQMVPFDWDAR